MSEGAGEARAGPPGFLRARLQAGKVNVALDHARAVPI